jgi:hypothetical protein
LVPTGEGRKSVVEGQNLLAKWLDDRVVRVEGDLSEIPSAFLSTTTTSVVHQQSTHGARGNGEKVGAILPGYIRTNEANEGLVHHLSRLQRVIPALSAQLTRGQPPELVVQQRRQLVESLEVALAPAMQQIRHVSCGHSFLVAPLGGNPHLDQPVFWLSDSFPAFRTRVLQQEVGEPDLTRCLRDGETISCGNLRYPQFFDDLLDRGQFGRRSVSPEQELASLNGRPRVFGSPDEITDALRAS